MTRERVLKLPVLEIFGPTFQGEGRAIGQKTMFVRTAGCDYHCDWCDSAFTWDGSEKPTRMTADEVIAALDKIGKLRLCNPIWGKSCYSSSQHGRIGHQAQGTRCHPCCRDSRFSLAKLVERHRSGHSESQTSFIQDGSQL